MQLAALQPDGDEALTSASSSTEGSSTGAETSTATLTSAASLAADDELTMNVDSAELVSCGDAGRVGMMRATDRPSNDGPDDADRFSLGRRDFDGSRMPSQSRDDLERRPPNSRGLGEGHGEDADESRSMGGASDILMRGHARTAETDERREG